MPGKIVTPRPSGEEEGVDSLAALMVYHGMPSVATAVTHPHSRRPKGTIVQRDIAIDNVCAWPNLTLLADGSIAAIIFNQPVHGSWEGEVECWASEDGGRTWDKRGVPAPHEPGTNRMNQAVGVANNGDLVVLVSGWDQRRPVGQRNPDLFRKSRVLPIWVCRSSDGGRTWRHQVDAIAPAPGEADGPARRISFGDIIRLGDATLGVAIYQGAPNQAEPEPRDGAAFYRSRDDGRTWTHVSPIRETDATETTLLSVGDGRLLAAVRTTGADDNLQRNAPELYGGERLELYASNDAGNHWTACGPLTSGRQIPAHLLRLADGRILLTFGIRVPAHHGLGGRVSDDGGRTWSEPRVLLRFRPDREDRENVDGGYPSSVQLDDGTIVTAYYAASAPDHPRYHMGVLRWQPGEWDDLESGECQGTSTLAEVVS